MKPFSYMPFRPNGQPVFTQPVPMVGAACTTLGGVWALSLNKGDYSKIEFYFRDGSKVVMKAQPWAVRMDPDTGVPVWGRRGRRVINPVPGGYRIQGGGGTKYVAPRDPRVAFEIKPDTFAFVGQVLNPPYDLGHFNCAGDYVMPKDAGRLERAMALFDIDEMAMRPTLEAGDAA